MNEKERKYCVYCHTNRVNGKKYVGITCQRLKARWGKNGRRYKGCTYFYNAIKKYGWDNFNHEILFKNLDKEEAESKEIKLIAEWNLTNENFGYNIAKGGATYSEEARAKLSKSLKGKRLGVQPSNYKPLVGKKFGRLTVISEFTRNWVHYCVCRCDCGNELKVLASNLYGHTNSCGCYMRERASQTSSTHKMTKTRIYGIWQYIKRRCYRENAIDYLEGIEMHDEWKNNFISFYSWSIANGYKENLSLLRKNNSRNYEPSNCFWGDIGTAKGIRIRCVETGIEYRSVREASKLTSISYSSIRRNLQGICKIVRSNNKGFHFVYITDEPPKDEKK